MWKDADGRRNADGKMRSCRWKPRPGDFREVAVGRKSVYEPLRRSGLFVFVNIASSRSLSRSHREQRAGEMSNYRRGALPIYTNLSRSSDPDSLFRALCKDVRFIKENVSSFNDTSAILPLNNEDYLERVYKNRYKSILYIDVWS